MRRFLIRGYLVALAVLAVTVFGCSDDDDDKPTPPADITAPAAVDDLAAGSPTDNSITLTWTAPGDDGDEGTAESYDVRYDTAEINDSTWAAANTVSDEPTPKEAGGSESFVVSGLTEGTMYYFAVKTTDDSDNVSAVSNSPGETTTGGVPSVEELLTASLHYTTDGMEYWYESEQGGFESMTSIDYRDLACQNCHVDPADCTDCHTNAAPTEGDAETDDTKCLGCHSRQAAEVNHGFGDVHRDAGMGCSDCHDAHDAHGDGSSPNSMLEAGVITAGCDDCHTSVPANTFHNTHGGDMECSACHVQSVVTCYNCHFESEVNGDGKIAFGQFKNWKLLVRRDRGEGDPKIAVGNFQSLTYQGKAFVAIAPYYAHTIAVDAIESCDDCHDNEYVQEYLADEVITVATWNEDTQALVPNIQGKGIIPVPPDWQTSLIFASATLDPANPQNPGARDWMEIDPTETGRQMLFALPLEGVPD